MKMTAAHMEPCKCGSSEVHNKREKKLDYVREDLSHLNESEILETISDRLTRIKEVYKAATGQKLQSSAAPIQEVVLVIDESTTMDQVKEFGRLCQKELGMTPFQYFIHRDEGHYEDLLNKTGWKANQHAHIVFDTTCYEHKMVKRVKKHKGHNVKDENGNLVYIEVDGYGKTIKFQKQDLSLMQDLAAQATGLERGIPSTKKHLSAMQFKCMQLLEELKENLAKVEASKQELYDINGEIKVEKLKASAADAGTAVLEAISGVFGGGKVKEQAKEIESLLVENKELRDEVEKVREEGEKNLKNLERQKDFKIQQLDEEIQEQKRTIGQLTGLFPHAQNCVANYATLSRMGLNHEQIKQLMTGAVLFYSGKLKNPARIQETHEVADVKIELSESKTGTMLPWLNGLSVAKFFQDLANKISQSVQWTGKLGR